MKKKLQKFITTAAAVAGSLVLSISAFAANGADPEGVMPFAADSTGIGASFVINNGGATEEFTNKQLITYTTDANLRFNVFETYILAIADVLW